MAAPTASVPPRALVPRVLIVAGSDSGGGAGIQADIKTCAAIGAFATTAVTALTAQDTKGVHGVHTVPAQFIGQQLDVVLSDIGVHVIKTGMLPNREAIAEVAAALEELSQTGSRSSTSDGANSSSRAVKNATDIDASLPPCPLLVVDPVMVSASGHALIDSDAVGALTSQLLPRAALVTPNLPEAKALLGGWAVNTVEEMRSAAKEIGSRFGCGAVLLKGGHLEDEKSAVVTDVYYESHSGRLLEFSSPRIPTRNSHGTGCTLASAISSHLARLMVENSRSSSSPCASLGVPSLLLTAVTRARGWLQQLLAASVPVTLGHGAHGPMNHSFAVDDYTGPSSPSSSSSSAAAALAANSSATSNDSSSSSSGSGLSISAPRPAAGSKRSAAVEAAGSEPAPESPVYSYFGSLSGPPASSKRPRVDDGGPSVSDAAANPSFDLRLYAVTDPRMNAKHGRSLVQAVSAAIDGGATIVQLREKNSETGEFVKAATDVMAYVSSLRASGDLRGGVRIIINDRVDVCLAAGADGVHLGQSDMPCATARSLLGRGKIIGVSADTVESARQAQAESADYLGCGTVYPTSTKADAGDAIGISGLYAVAHSVTIPVVAIGGINAGNAAGVLAGPPLPFDVSGSGSNSSSTSGAANVAGGGVTGVAVVSALFDAPDGADVTAATARMRSIVDAALAARAQ